MAGALPASARADSVLQQLLTDSRFGLPDDTALTARPYAPASPSKRLVNRT